MMVAKDSYQELVEENPKTNMQEYIDDAEETLSFCDLPIYSDSADWEDFSKEYQSSSSSSLSSEQDYFEFFSGEWNTNTTTTTTTHEPENVIFCGKLIPYKQPISGDTQKVETKEHSKHKKRSLFRWNSDSFNKPKTASKLNCSKYGTNGRQTSKNEAKVYYVSKSFSSLPGSEKHGYNTGKCGDKYDFSVKRVSVLTSPVKSRWYLFMFGSARFPTEMELSDIRNRQSRLSSSRTKKTALFRSNGGGEMESDCRKRGKGLWGLIRALRCGGQHHANAVVKASISCNPHV